MIQRELQNPLAQMILEGTVPDGSTVHVSAKDGKLTSNRSCGRRREMLSFQQIVAANLMMSL